MNNCRQHDATDCGAACLAFVLHHYHLNVSLAQLRGKTGTDQWGTTALGLVEAAESSGLSAKGIRCQIADLGSIALPAIAHLQLEHGRHFVVITAVGRRGYKIMDPAIGKVVMWTQEHFARTWSGAVIILAPAANFKPGNRTKSPLLRVCELLIPRRLMLLQSFVGIVLDVTPNFRAAFRVSLGQRKDPD